MLKKALLLFTILLFTGCVERGYKLTVNQTTKTITAIKSIDIRKDTPSSTKKDIDQMNTAVDIEQKKQSVKKVKPKPNNTSKPAHQKPTETKKVIQKEKEDIIQQQSDELKALEKEKNHAKNLRIKELEEERAKEERAALEKKLTLEENKKNRLAALQREALLKKEAAEKKLQADKAQALEAQKETKAKEALRNKLQLEKAEQARKIEAQKRALELKIANEQKVQAQKAQAEKLALERKLTEEKTRHAEIIKMQQIAKAKAEASERLAKAKLEAAERLAKIKKEKALQAHKLAEEKKASINKTEKLTFKPSTQTYQKFGTSEIHGHVVYLTPSGQEISLQNTKIYLVPKNAKTDYWYNNYYLKNREAKSLTKTVVHYMNATHLNLESNFAFYGLAQGIYYIIIESSYPSSIAKHKKVYIAKKIDVKKYKKIMTVFSKRL